MAPAPTLALSQSFESVIIGHVSAVEGDTFAEVAVTVLELVGADLE